MVKIVHTPAEVSPDVEGSACVDTVLYKAMIGDLGWLTWVYGIHHREADGSLYAHITNKVLCEELEITPNQLRRVLSTLRKKGILYDAPVPYFVLDNPNKEGRKFPICKRVVLGNYKNGQVYLPEFLLNEKNRKKMQSTLPPRQTLIPKIEKNIDLNLPPRQTLIPKIEKNSKNLTKSNLPPRQTLNLPPRQTLNFEGKNTPPGKPLYCHLDKPLDENRIVSCTEELDALFGIGEKMPSHTKVFYRSKDSEQSSPASEREEEKFESRKKYSSEKIEPNSSSRSPAAKLFLNKLLPLFPSDDLLKIPEMPPPPHLPSSADNKELAQILAANYRVTMEAAFGKKVYCFKKGDISKSKHYRKLYKAGCLLRDLQIRPMLWISFVTEMWLHDGLKTVLPPVTHIFAVSLISKHASWYREEEKSRSINVSTFPESFRPLKATYDAFMSEYRRLPYLDTVGEMETQINILMEKWFPGGWKAHYRKVIFDAVLLGEKIKKDIAEGKNLWISRKKL